MDNSIPSSSSWFQQWAALGGVSAITGVLGWMTSHRMMRSNIRKFDAETKLIEEQTRHERITEASTIENSRADFEKALNDRTTRVMDSLETQVRRLSELVQAQSTQLSEQSFQIQKMEGEIQELRKALDARTNDLNKMRLIGSLLNESVPIPTVSLQDEG